MFVIRSVLVLIMLLWLTVAGGMASLIPVSGLRRFPSLTLQKIFIQPLSLKCRFFLRYIHILGCRAVLLVSGFHFIDSRVAHPRMPSKRFEDSPGTGWCHSPLRHLDNSFADIKSGDIIVCNYVSYIQPLYLAFRFSPTFVSLLREGEGAGEMGVPRGLFGAMLDVLKDRHPGLPISRLFTRAYDESFLPYMFQSEPIVFPSLTS